MNFKFSRVSEAQRQKYRRRTLNIYLFIYLFIQAVAKLFMGNFTLGPLNVVKAENLLVSATQKMIKTTGVVTDLQLYARGRGFFNWGCLSHG